MKLRLSKLFLTLLAFTFVLTCKVTAQENLNYQKPPKEILDMLDFERPPQVTTDSRNRYMIFSYRDNYKSLDELNQPEMRLAGLRINPVTNIETGVNYFNNIKIKRIADLTEIPVEGLPENPKLAFLRFSPDESMMAFTHTSGTGVELWVLDVESASAKRVSEAVINANLGNPYSWLNDSKSLLVRVLPPSRGKLTDQNLAIPKGPIISESDGKESQNRTYQDLLKNRLDEQNFETLIMSELHVFNVNGTSSKFMDAALYVGESLSPDGNYIMITTLEKPYSYVVPMNRFPQKSVVYDFSGKEIKVVNEVPLQEYSPRGYSSTRTGRRAMYWRSDKPATLYFVEAIDGGDGDKEADFRDELFSWEAPFENEPTSLVKTPQRFAGVSWGDDSRAIFMDSKREKSNAKTYLFNPSDPTVSPVLINDRNTQDVYSDPGQIATVKNQFDRQVMMIIKDHIYLVGQGFTPEGQFPFVDKLNLKTLKKERVYQSQYTDKKEDIESITDIVNGNMLVRIQSQTEYPNLFMRNISRKRNNLVQLTDFVNPFKVLSDVHKEVIRYTREDGIELSGTLYLPVGYDKEKKEKVPMLLWAYPREFKDASAASQVTQNPNQFTMPSYGSFVYWVTRGYAVLQDAAFPIVGEGDAEPNDTFVEQLIMNAKAAIEAVDTMGYIDKTKVAAGGHSYGAFMTANLLSHCDLFACGIARSGAYNRTLTPFGFQNERRNYWEVPEVYSRMSPFMNANKMKTPILLIHGEADNNSGTFTMQTERYFQALKGLGAPARMVILPMESHGYAAKENILHLLWEQDRFLEKHLKNK
jgi:dipeptidyl aminopeptidase/acylaminoacyl peptidase